MAWRYTGFDHDEAHGAIALGPGATVYVYANKLVGALSEGAVGDPDEAGMDFVDNSPPSEAANPSPADHATGLAER